MKMEDLRRCLVYSFYLCSDRLPGGNMTKLTRKQWNMDIIPCKASPEKQTMISGPKNVYHLIFDIVKVSNNLKGEEHTQIFFLRCDFFFPF